MSKQPSAPNVGVVDSHTDTPSTVQKEHVDSVPIVSRTNGARLKDYTNHPETENYDLIAKVIWMINTYPGWSEDGTFTFPDGETWAKLEGEDSE